LGSYGKDSANGISMHYRSIGSEIMNPFFLFIALDDHPSFPFQLLSIAIILRFE
jgi:hypothetical protein